MPSVRPDNEWHYITARNESCAAKDNKWIQTEVSTSVRNVSKQRTSRERPSILSALYYRQVQDTAVTGQKRKQIQRPQFHRHRHNRTDRATRQDRQYFSTTFCRRSNRMGNSKSHEKENASRGNHSLNNRSHSDKIWSYSKKASLRQRQGARRKITTKISSRSKHRAQKDHSSFLKTKRRGRTTISNDLRCHPIILERQKIDERVLVLRMPRCDR